MLNDLHVANDTIVIKTQLVSDVLAAAGDATIKDRLFEGAGIGGKTNAQYKTTVP
jgi:hypothetical protein